MQAATFRVEEVYQHPVVGRSPTPGRALHRSALAALADATNTLADETVWVRRTGHDLLGMRAFDVRCTPWDLAPAIGTGEQLDAERALTVLEVLKTMSAVGGPGFGIAPVGLAGPTDTPSARVLDLSGRRLMSRRTAVRPAGAAPSHRTRQPNDDQRRPAVAPDRSLFVVKGFFGVWACALN